MLAIRLILRHLETLPDAGRVFFKNSEEKNEFWDKCSYIMYEEFLILNRLINSSAVKHNCFSFINHVMEKYYHTIQDWHRFADAVTDLVEDYIKYSTDIDENDGIYVDDDDNVSLISRNDAPDEDNYHGILNLLDMRADAPEVSYDAVQELTDKYIFVR